MGRRVAEEGLKITIPTMGWEQIGGDMDPGTYGGTIATADGNSIELIKIQPVREHVGDKEAADVGFPFWTREAYFDASDLDPSNKDVQSALDSIDMDLDTLEADLTPTQRALVIAEALLDYGRADEGPAGWSGDIGIPDKVKWSSGKIAGSEYIADEDEAFVREVLLDDLDIDYESYGPNEKSPTSGLKVETRGQTPSGPTSRMPLGTNNRTARRSASSTPRWSLTNSSTRKASTAARTAETRET